MDRRWAVQIYTATAGWVLATGLFERKDLALSYIYEYGWLGSMRLVNILTGEVVWPAERFRPDDR